MGKKEFDEYLKKQQTNTKAETQIDWVGRKEEWLKYLDRFYEQVKEFLSEYKDDVRFDSGEKDINEDLIGQYRARFLRLHINTKDVVLDPVGTNLIGARGRIDMTGNAGTVRFVLIDKNLSGLRRSVATRTEGEPDQKPVEWTWKISTPPPRIEYIDLNAESFLDALMEVING